MQTIYGDIQALGGEVLVVAFAAPAQLQDFLRELPQPFAVVADPQRKAYQALALGSTSLLGLLRPRVIWHYLKLIFRGWLPKGPAKDADVWQLGGDFVIDRGGRLVYAHPSGDAADRPSAAQLLQAMRQAAA